MRGLEIREKANGGATGGCLVSRDLQPSCLQTSRKWRRVQDGNTIMSDSLLDSFFVNSHSRSKKKHPVLIAGKKDIPNTNVNVSINEPGFWTYVYYI